MSSDLKYYIYLDNKVQGPHDFDFVLSMGLPTDTKVCPEGSTEWIEISNLKNSSSKTSLDKIGKYKVIQEIGRGGMGSVYLGTDEVLNRQVAIKELKTDENKKNDAEVYSTLVRRFKREAQILAQLSHKNIVAVYDIIEKNQDQYIIMEYLHGKTLEDILEEEKVISLEKSLDFVSNICLALDYIHKKNIVHRDIKPSNIMILEDGTAKVTDFGVTRDLNSATMTNDGSLVGTIAYASPEQDSKDLDGRSDIFSLGIVFYEIVTGQKPFIGDTIAAVLLKIATKDPVKPSELNPKVHKMLDNIIMKALAKNLSQRYQTAMEMYNDLQAYKEALTTNNTALLYGVKTNDKLLNQNVKVDSIPPNKLQAKNFMQQSVPPNKLNIKDIPNLNNVNQSVPVPLANKQTFPPLTKSVINNAIKEETFNKEILEKVEEANFLPEINLEEKKEEELHKEEKITNTKKTKSLVSEQIEQERKEALINTVVPLSIFVISILLYFTGAYGLVSLFLLLSSISFIIYEMKAKQVNINISNFLFILFTLPVFVISKSYFPELSNPKISNVIYYALDFSILCISLIISLLLLKGINALFVNNNHSVRYLGSILKAIILTISLLVYMNFTDFIDSKFINKEISQSNISKILDKLVPLYKSGKKNSVKFTNFGVKIGII